MTEWYLDLKPGDRMPLMAERKWKIPFSENPDLNDLARYERSGRLEVKAFEIEGDRFVVEGYLTDLDRAGHVLFDSRYWPPKLYTCEV